MVFTGLSSWGNGFIWVNEFRGILEGFGSTFFWGCLFTGVSSPLLWFSGSCFGVFWVV